MKKPMTGEDSIDCEAADWVVKWDDREREPTSKEQARWFRWLQRSPRHVQSYFDTADVFERLSSMDPGNRIDVDEWLTDRRTPVVSIASAATATTLEKWPRPHSRWHWAAAAASLAAIAVSVSLWSFLKPNTFRTTVGQQSINRLEDGSVVNLNTQSKVRVVFSDTRRVVELEGEALFTVTHDPARPFIVRTHDATIRVLGTQFNVYQQDGETRVSVVEGEVQVRPASAEIDERMGIALSAGEAAHVSLGEVSKDPAPDIESQVAWRHQQLVFEDATLAEVAREFNRYNTIRFRVEPAIGNSKRLSGTFDARHPQSLLLYLQRDAAVSVQTVGDELVVRGR